jgi:glycosyltransferase involved in cell wall biosynthesis
MEKGIEVLFKSLSEVSKKNKNWKLIVVGKGKDSNKLKKLAKELKIDKKVIFAGFVPRSDVYAYYHLSDMVIIPSTFPETFGIVLTEAWLAKKLVIGSKLGALGYRIRDKKNGFLVKPNDSKGLTNRINYILNNYRNLDYISQKGYINVKKEHDSRKSFSQFLKIIEGVK